VPTDSDVVLPARPGAPTGLRLALRTTAPPTDEPGAVPFLLVHGLSSNSRTWDGVARELAAAGHRAVAVDQRGHGRSDAPPSGYDTLTCADDLAALITSELITSELITTELQQGLFAVRPIVVGQSWGGNVVLALAARRPDLVAAVACVDGGWLRLADRFADEAQAWAAMAPPSFDGLRYHDLALRIREGHPDWSDEGIAATLANLVELDDGGVRARLSRDHHRAILGSMVALDPADLYPQVSAPVLLVPSALDGDGVAAAQAALPDAQVRAYPGADHDVHVQQPTSLAADLLALADRSAR
jgi:pimeloyl-ACP methyl ester carboxylesterase